MKRVLVKQLNLTGAERQRIEASLSEERQLVLDLVEFRAALQEITRITSLKVCVSIVKIILYRSCNFITVYSG